MHNKKFKKIVAIVLCVLSLISVVIPAVASNAAETNPLVKYDTNMHIDLQDLAWHNNPTLKSCLVTKVAYDTNYIDKNGIVYKLKVYGRTAEIDAISTPVGMETIVIPRYVTLYRLFNTNINDGNNASGELVTENDKSVYFWDFSSYVNTKKDSEGNITSQSGPSVVVITETVEITGVKTSFAENVTTVKNIVLPDSIATIDSNGFADNPYIENIYGPGILEVSKRGFYNCKNLTNAIFPKIKYIREQAFYKCISLKNFNLNNALAIEKEAFFDCITFTEINLPVTIQTLGQGAFKQCTNLKSVTIPKGISVNTIPAECFYLCSKLENIDFPTDIIAIGNEAFLNCDSLRVLDLRKTNISTIGAQAFWGCIKLAYIVLPETLVSFKTTAFENCSSLRFIYFMSNLTKTQLEQIQKSEIAKCTITELDTAGPLLKNQSSNNITTYTATTFTAHDIVDVSEVYIDNKLVDVKTVNYTGNGYLTYGKSFSITEKGTHKVTLVDLLGNKSYYTISYINKLGDLDGDGQVLAADARLALRMSVGLEKVDMAADIDKDGKVASADARLILRKSVGLEKF